MCFLFEKATQFFGPKDMFTDMVETLINAGCDLDLGDKSGYTPLYQAAFGGEVGKCYSGCGWVCVQFIYKTNSFHLFSSYGSEHSYCFTV